MLNSFHFSILIGDLKFATSIMPFVEEVEHVIQVGSLIISVNKNAGQKSLYLFTKEEMKCLRFSLRINFPF